MNDETRNQVAVLERELAEEREARQALAQLSVRLNSLLNLPDLLYAIMTTAAELLDAESSALMLFDEETNELIFEVVTGETEHVVEEQRMPADRGIAGWVLQHAEPAVVNDVGQDTRFYRDIDRSSGFTTRSILAMPLMLRDRPIGVVEIINKRGGSGFSERDRDLAAAFAAQAAVALDNARLYQKLTDALVTCRMSYRL